MTVCVSRPQNKERASTEHLAICPKAKSGGERWRLSPRTGSERVVDSHTAQSVRQNGGNSAKGGHTPTRYHPQTEGSNADVPFDLVLRKRGGGLGELGIAKPVSRVLILHIYSLAKSISQQLGLRRHWNDIYM